MRNRFGLFAGALVSAGFGYGLVYAAMHLERALPLLSYVGFCQHVLLAIQWLYSGGQGWEHLGNVEDFGRFYAAVVPPLSALAGFAVFRLASRPRGSVWPPLGLCAVAAAVLTQAPLQGPSAPWQEAAAVVLMMLAMAAAGSEPADAIPPPSPRGAQSRPAVPDSWQSV